MMMYAPEEFPLRSLSWLMLKSQFLRGLRVLRRKIRVFGFPLSFSVSASLRLCVKMDRGSAQPDVINAWGDSIPFIKMFDEVRRCSMKFDAFFEKKISPAGNRVYWPMRSAFALLRRDKGGNPKPEARLLTEWTE